MYNFLFNIISRTFVICRVLFMRWILPSIIPYFIRMSWMSCGMCIPWAIICIDSPDPKILKRIYKKGFLIALTLSFFISIVYVHWLEKISSEGKFFALGLFLSFVFIPILFRDTDSKAIDRTKQIFRVILTAINPLDKDKITQEINKEISREINKKQFIKSAHNFYNKFKKKFLPHKEE